MATRAYCHTNICKGAYTKRVKIKAFNQRNFIIQRRNVAHETLRNCC